MKYFLLLFFASSFLVLNSCDFSKKNAELEEREQRLLDKEKDFALKESEYQNLIKMRDSLLSEKDSVEINTLPEHILGKWSAKIVCNESNCPENMIGDIRIDTWEFSENGATVSAKVTNKAGNIRIYNGTYNGTDIRLKYESDSAAARKADIQIVLNDIQENKMRGTREFHGENNCISRFSVDLDKSKN